MGFTADQRKIIAAAPDDILVSAAAGSGKTYTMTHRIVERVKTKQLSMDRVLVLTFTEKAADNMRARMSQVLHDALSEASGPDRQYLMEQELRLRQADISTIHAFCYKLIREHGALLGSRTDRAWPDAAAPALETEEQERLLLEAIDFCLNEAYAEADAAFLDQAEEQTALVWQLSDAFGNAKGDEPLRELLKQLHGFLRSMPDYEDWVEQALAEYRASFQNFQESGAYRFYCERLGLQLERARIGLEKLYPDLSQSEPPLFKANPKFKAEINAENELIRNAYLQLFRGIDALQTLFDEAGGLPDWDQVVRLGRELVMPEIRRAGKDPIKLAIIDHSRAYLAELLHFINGSCGTKTYKEHFLYEDEVIFDKNEAEISRELSEQYARLQGLFQLLLQVDRQFAELKSRANVLDFSDMEHFALSLVRLPEVKAFYRQKFAEIYIDEYQDTSTIQNEIIGELTQQNLFMVGDIKQSIYRFRHANPTLFSSRYMNLKSTASESLHELNTNFRSTPAVLRAINLVFSELMTRDAAEIDYLDGHALGIPEDKAAAEAAAVPPSGQNPSASGPPAACTILVYSDSRAALGTAGPRELLIPQAAEGMSIAGEIVKLLAEGVKPEAIAILSRNHDALTKIATVFSRLGIEYSYTKEQRFLSSVVLRTVIALLRLVENPLQDDYLASVLLHFSPWGSFSVHELLSIKRESLQGPSPLSFEHPFHEALARYLETGRDEALREKLKNFMRALDQLRQRSLSLDVNRLIAVIYDEFGLLSMAAQETEGENKVKQLEAFELWAEGFVKSGRNSLYELNRELRTNDDLILLNTEERTEEIHGVQLMTFHHSKGLEFPYVFICKTDMKIKTQAMNPIAYSQNHGFAVAVADSARVKAHPSLVQTYINSKEVEADLAEHLRLIYVAMTRAEKRIYLSLPLKELSSALEFIGQGRENRGCDGLLPSWLINRAAKQSMMSLIALGLAALRDVNWAEVIQQVDESVGGLGAAGDSAERPELQDRCFGDFAILFRDSADILKGASEQTKQDGISLLASARPAPSGVDSLFELYKLEQGRAAGTELFWELDYAFMDATRSGIKYSVSEIKDKAYQDALQDDEADGGTSSLQPLRDSTRVMRPLTELTDSAETGKSSLTPAALGSLLHSVLRYLKPQDYLNLSTDSARAKLAEDLHRYQDSGLLTGVEEAAIEAQSSQLLAYLGSARAAEVARCDAPAEGTMIYREIPFTLAWSARELLKGSDQALDDKVLVQGIVDLWYRCDGKTVVLDFKSDRITGTDEEVLAELKKRYAAQLSIYSQAVKRESGAKVDEQVIWLLSRGREYLVN